MGTRRVDLIAGRPASQPPGPSQTRHSESFATHTPLQIEHPPRKQSRSSRRRGEREEERTKRKTDKGDKVDMVVDTVKEANWIRRDLWFNLFSQCWILTPSLIKNTVRYPLVAESRHSPYLRDDLHT